MIALYNKDCFEGMRSIAPQTVDLVLTDPPFACTDIHWDKKVDFNLFRNLLKYCCKDKALFVCFSLQPLTSLLINTFKQQFKYMLYWNKIRKTGYLNAKKVPLRQIEEIIVFKVFSKFYNQTYNPQVIKTKKRLIKSAPTPLYTPKKGFVYGQKHYSDIMYPTNLITEIMPQEERFHPTQKPVKLVEWLIKTYSNEGDLVLDPFSGSATTAIACINTNRNFIGFELEPSYFEKAITRINNAKELKIVDDNTISEIEDYVQTSQEIKPQNKQLYLF